MMPESGAACPEEVVAGQPPEPVQPPMARNRYHYILGLAFAIICFEVGISLVVFPWLHYWNWNYFSTLTPGWHEFWLSPYFRGAVSGVGLLNLYLSLLEVLHLQESRVAQPPGAVALTGGGHLSAKIKRTGRT